MNLNRGLPLVAPRVSPELDPDFRPAVLANRRFQDALQRAACAVPVGLAIEQSDGSIFHHATSVFPEDHPEAAGNFSYLERCLKFLLWSRGGFRVHFKGPTALCQALTEYYATSSTGKFDAHIMGDRIYERPFTLIQVTELPPARMNTMPLGRHLDGCRIGFDLGGSDRKVAAMRDGKCVFSEEVVWDPIRQADPQYHFDGIADSLKRAAHHLPRVDAIGGSAAGVYVNNRVKVASLFRGLPPDLFESRAKNIFLELKQAWNNIPFEVVNDGEVTALAGSMSLGVSAVLGTALGTSQAGGYVTPDGNITSWLNELAFVPVDYNPNAPADEWSGDRGCGALYFSQQAVGRLIPAAGLPIDMKLGLPERLKAVQHHMDHGDDRARKIYETIGTYLGYAVAHYADFYDIQHLLILGRVTSGPGGDLILQGARRVLDQEFPELSARLAFHVPDETEKRHGQAMAAASLPALPAPK